MKSIIFNADQFCTIATNRSKSFTPANADQWKAQRESQSLIELCRQIEETDDEEIQKRLKNQLPCWTPRCAKFYGNKRNEKNALVQLKRIVFDIDEKGHTDEILSKMEKDAEGRHWIGEFRILLVEESIRRGTHVVATLPDNMTLNEAQSRFSSLSGYKVDPAVKNVAGFIYQVPADHTRFQDYDFTRITSSDIIGATDNDNPSEKLEGKKEETNDEEEDHQAVEEILPTAEEEPKYKGIAYSSIIEAYWQLYNNGDEPVQGDRNSKTFELARDIACICNYDIKMLMRVIPRYDNFPEEEYRQTLSNALKSNQSGLSLRIKAAVNKASKLHQRELISGTANNPPAMPEKLPLMMEKIASNAKPLCRAIICESAFAALASYLHKVKIRYTDNKIYEINFIHATIAPSSSGKGETKDPIVHIMKAIKERDNANRSRRTQIKRQNARKGANQQKEVVSSDNYIQWINPDATGASLVELAMAVNENGERPLFSYIEELENMKDMLKGKNLSTILKLSFDNAILGQERVGCDSVCGEAPLRWNIAGSTTPDTFRKTFEKCIIDGTLNRLNLATIIPQKIFGAKNEACGIYNEAYDEALKPYIDNLSNAEGLIECPEAWTFLERLEQKSADISEQMESHAYENCRRRGLVIAYRKAMLLFIANGYVWDKLFESYVEWSFDYDLWCKMYYFGDRMEKKLTEENKIGNNAPVSPLDLVGAEFTLKELQEVREQLGKKGDIHAYLRQQKCRGFIEYETSKGPFYKTGKKAA